MNKHLLLALSFFITCSVAGQTKTISLEDAVMQQGRKFRADKMLGFQWIPKTNKYFYFEDSGRKLVSASANSSNTVEVVTLANFNKALGTELYSFFGIEYKNEDTIIINNGDAIYEYSISNKKGTKIATLPAEAANSTFDDSKAHVAYTLKNNLFILTNSGKTIAITNNENKDIVSGDVFARSEFGISKGIFWSPKSSAIAFYQKDESEVADYPLLDITETPGKLINLKYPMTGQKSEKPKVGIYNIASGKTVFISPQGKSDDYLTNLTWTPDDKYVLIAEVNRGQNDMHLNLYDATTGAFVRTLIREQATTWVEPEHDAFFPSKSSNSFVWISEKDGFDNLYYYTIEGKLIKKLTSNKFPATAIIGVANNEIYFNATGSNAMNNLVYKVNLKGKQSLVTKNEGVHSFAISEDGKHFFDEYSNSTTPSKSIMMDSKGNETVIMTSENKYKDYVIGTSDIKILKANDGKTDLYTRMIKPSNFDASKKYPVLVYVYGGPHAQMNTNSYLDGASLWMYWMAEQGYIVFTLDNRGSANRGKQFEEVIHRNLGQIEMADQLTGVEYLKSLPYIDGNRLAVHGWSYGGFMTNSMMLQHPGVFKVGVAGGPVTDWKYYEIMYGERYMDTPEENPEGFDKASTMNYVKNLEGKLLLIHGSIDDVVVMQHNLSLIKKFIEAEKQVDFFVYPMHKHNVSGKDRVHLMRKVLDYVIDNNK
ncbi:S9 family peptidase [Flavobacterium ardleyense]|uniref:S9 family peptidase n=1 Tax=Flavobacterium ardleyense TaxID=2038737 RepID=UPI00298C4778|nr:DPP IV N-terminal domain-containing protein [Flavobacterium ardleyense]